MVSNNEKGKKYEGFSKEILLLQNLTWDYDSQNKNIKFDKDVEDHKIEGISGQKHQIDIHLISSKNPEFHLLCECKAHNPAVEKTHACSFVTVITDIRDKHKDWKIIPVFTAEDGYQSGAKKILHYYKIIYFEMKDYRNVQRTFNTNITSKMPKFEELNGTLEDGTIVDRDVCLINYSRGDIYGITNAIKSFELFDSNNKKIENLIDFTGEFHTGDRCRMIDDSDEFYEVRTNKKLVAINGTVVGNTTCNLGSSQTVIKSKAVTNIILGDGNIYRINKDGTCEKYYDQDESKKIFE